MTVQRSRRSLIGLLLMAVALISLTGCQMLGNPQQQVTDSVVVASPAVDFGTVTIGNSKTIGNNIGNFKTTSVTISSISGLSPEYQLQGISFPVVLSSGQQMGFTVTFQPTSPGKPSATVTFIGDGGQTYASMTLDGSAISAGQLNPNPSSVAFGNMKVGQSKSINVALSNTGSTAVTVNSAALSGAAFSMGSLVLPLTLQPNQNTTLSVTFTPPAGGNFTGSISFNTAAAQQGQRKSKSRGAAQGVDGSSDVVVPLQGDGVTPGALTAAPTTLPFGNVQVGATGTISETLTNTGGSNVTISQANVTGTGFSITGLTLPATLTPNQSVTFSAKFTPASAGAASGSLSIVSDASNSPLGIPWSGTGVTQGQLSPNPATLAFGNVQVTKTANLPETLTNNGGAPVTISQANVTGAGFSISGLTLPVTLNPTQSVSFTATFAPSATGAATGTLAIISDASNSPLNIGLSGAGVTQGALTPNPTSQSFGSVQIGSSKTLPQTLTNSGGTSVTISAASATGAGFSISGITLPLTLNAGQSTSVNVQFAPSAAGNATGNVNITSNGANSSLAIPLSGDGVTPGTMSPNPSLLAFGSVTVGSNTSLPETLTNTGGVAVTISAANVTGGAGFSVSGLTLPATINPAQSITFNVTFTPAAAGSVTGSLAIVSTASNSPLNIQLSGRGLAPGSLTANPSSVSFGNVLLGTTPSKSVTLTNTGGTSVTISSSSVTGTGFSINGLTLPLTLNAGQGTTFNVVFSPTSAGAITGTVVINSDAVNPVLDIDLSGTGVTQGQITSNPTSQSFGNVLIGNTKSQNQTLTNSGGTSLTISAATVTGTGFSITGLTLPLTLNAGQSTTFSVRFAPSAAGSATGNLNIASNGANPSLDIALSGTGVTPGTLSPNPASIAFGSVQTGKNSSLPETLTNTGGAAVTITQANVTGAGFTVTGLTLPVTVNPNQTVTFNVVFAPTSAGAVTGNVAVVSDASNSPLNIGLSGTGVLPGTLSPNPATLAFGNVTIGNGKDLPETITNTGGSTVTITQANVTGTGFSISGLTLPATLNPSQSVSFTARFTPSAAGAVTGKIAVVSDASNSPLNINLSGTGVTPGTLSANPTSISFGNVQLTSSKNLSEMLTNSGGTAVTISQANVTGTGFSITGLTLPTTLNPGNSVTFTATFAPAALGAASGNLAIVSDGSNSPLNIALSGTGTAQGTLAVTPTTLDFGDVVVGANSTKSGRLTASGASVTITAGSSNSAEFVLSGITFPVTLTAGQSTTFSVQFTPQSTGAASASLTFSSNASNSPTVETLTGNGTQPQPHSVDLTWQPSAGAVGYNIYRRTPSTGYGSPINSTLISSTADTDTGVSAGQVYLYVATAVDGNGIESGHSNEIQVTIPTP